MRTVLAMTFFIVAPVSPSANFIMSSMGDVRCEEYTTMNATITDNGKPDDERQQSINAYQLVHAYVNGYFQARYDLSVDSAQMLEATSRGYIDGMLLEYCAKHPADTIHDVLKGGHLSLK